MITLDEFMALRCSREIEYLYPIHGAEHIHISSVTILEYPVSDYVRKNELELTTCLSLREDQTRLLDYLQQIIDSGAAGIVLALPPESHALLEIIRRHFEAGGFPILVSPWEKKFGEIIEDALWNIWANAQNALCIKENFVYRLSSRNYTSEEQLLADAAVLGFPASSYLCIIGTLPGKDMYPYERYHMQEQFTQTASRLHRTVMTAFSDQHLILFLEIFDFETASDLICRYLDQAEQKIAGHLQNRHFIWGYDEHPARIPQLHQRYHTARIALDYAQKAALPGNRCSYQNSNRNIVFHCLSDNQNVAEIARKFLQELLDYDSKKQSSLMETLQAFCHCDHNVSRAALQLHLHRQSLLYRLAKIEELCHISLQSHEDLFFLELCVQIYQISQDKGTVSQ